MTLEQCTKEELIYIIKRLTNRPFEANKTYLNAILSELDLEREKIKMNEAERWSKIANDARKEYCDFLRKYEGWSLTDVPTEEVERAIELINTAEKADKKYLKLLGIEQARDQQTRPLNFGYFAN